MVKEKQNKNMKFMLTLVIAIIFLLASITFVSATTSWLTNPWTSGSPSGDISAGYFWKARLYANQTIYLRGVHVVSMTNYPSKCYVGYDNGTAITTINGTFVGNYCYYNQPYRVEAGTYFTSLVGHPTSVWVAGTISNNIVETNYSDANLMIVADGNWCVTLTTCDNTYPYQYVVTDAYLYGTNETSWNSNLNSGLLSYWTLNTDGNDVFDKDLSPINSPALTTSNCKIGNCYYFNGSNYFINNSASTGSTGYPTGTSASTLSLWFKTADNSGNVGMFFTYGPSSYQADRRFYRYNTNIYGVATSDGGFITATTSYDNLWHHAVVVNPSGSTAQQLWIDGINVYNATDWTGNTAVGKISIAGDGSSNLIGYIDEVAMWNRTLNSSEINQIFNNGNGNGYPQTNTTYPQISFGTGTLNNNTWTNKNFLYVNVSVTELNEANLTFRLYKQQPYCLQEDAVVSNQKGEDSCASILNYSGSYSFSGSSQYGYARLHDGDWYLWDNPYWMSGVETMYVNYTKPLFTNSTIIWKTNVLSQPNITTPLNASCVSAYTDKIVLRTQSENTASPYANFDCYNGASWVRVYTYPSSQVAEEGIIWYSSNIIMAPVNSTTLGAGNRTINWTNLADGTYYYNVLITDKVNQQNTTDLRVNYLDAVNPSISFGNGTLANNSYVQGSNIYVNVSAYDMYENNITFNLWTTGNATCYQESFDTSNQTGLDSCSGLNYTGNATKFALGGWVNQGYLYDGNWSTSSQSDGNYGGTNINIYYKKPSSFNPVTQVAIWSVKDFNGTYNYTIPYACMNWSNYIEFVFASISAGQAQAMCSYGNGSSYYFAIHTGGSAIYEEAVYWSLNNGIINTNSTTYNAGTRTINWTNLANGRYWYNVIDRDIIGNQNSTETRYLTLDTNPPVVSLNLPLNNSFTNQTTINFTANISDATAGIKNATLNVYNTIYGCSGFGGNITLINGTCIHTFYTNGTFNITTPTNIQVLIVAGGGGGGGINAGGGGAGGLIYNSSMNINSGNYPVVIGQGGVGGGVFIVRAGNGQNSFFNGYTAIGGGSGGQYDYVCTTGGSGGGVRDNEVSPCAGVTGQGNYGGLGYPGAPTYAGGGGGGAGGNGTGANNTQAGSGGNGLTYSINGSSVCYAGGGGGQGNAGLGGLATCGGANGNPTGIGGACNSTQMGYNGTANSGGGGGGANCNPGLGGNGGSGIVIITYPTSSGEVLINQTTNTFLENVLTYTIGIPVVLVQGVYKWFYNIFDWAGNQITSENRTLTIDTQNPNIFYGTGTLANNTFVNSNSVYVNVSITDTNEANVTFDIYNSIPIQKQNVNCYQETANQSTSCGGLNSGTYSVPNPSIWTDLNNIYDGFWNTTTTQNTPSASEQYVYINYSKPAFSLSAVVQYKDYYVTGNYSVFNDCFNYSYLTLPLRINSYVFGGSVTQKLECYNGTTWKSLVSNTGITSTFYEEAIIWNVSSYNSTTLGAGNRTFNWTNLPNTKYYYQITEIDKGGNSNSTELRTITLDTSAPIVTSTSPANNLITNETMQNFTATITDNFELANATFNIYYSNQTLHSSTFYNLSSLETSSYSASTQINLTHNLYIWNYQAIDKAGLTTFSNNRSIYIDTEAPDLFLISPTNKSHINSVANFTVNITNQFTNLTSATLQIYNSTGSLVNETSRNLTLLYTNQTVVGIVVNLSTYSTLDTFYWHYHATDTYGHEDNSTIFEITLDTIKPQFAWNVPVIGQNPWVKTAPYTINVVVTDDYLDAVNLSVYDNSGVLYYNNFTQNLTTTFFNVGDTITLHEGRNKIELSARDSLTSSPEIRSKSKFNKNDEQISIFSTADNSETITRKITLFKKNGQKINHQTQHLNTTNTWIDDYHYKTTWVMDKMPKDFYIEINLTSDNSLRYLNDRGVERIVSNNYYFRYDDISSWGFNVTYKQINSKSVLITITEGTADVTHNTMILDPITGGLNTNTQSEYVYLDTIAPTGNIGGSGGSGTGPSNNTYTRNATQNFTLNITDTNQTTINYTLYNYKVTPWNGSVSGASTGTWGQLFYANKSIYISGVYIENSSMTTPPTKCYVGYYNNTPMPNINNEYTIGTYVGTFCQFNAPVYVVNGTHFSLKSNKEGNSWINGPETNYIGTAFNQNKSNGDVMIVYDLGGTWLSSPNASEPWSYSSKTAGVIGLQYSFSLTDVYVSGIQNYTLTITNGSGTIINQTTVDKNREYSIFEGIVYLLWYEGIYKWYYTIVDYVGNIFTTSTYQITYDITPPSGNIDYPRNMTYNYTVTNLNYTMTEINPHNCYWTNNSGVNNYTITCGVNITTGIASLEGTNTWKLYINDSVGFINESSVTFIQDTTPPSIIIISPSNGVYYNTTNIFINISVSDITSPISKIWYFDGISNTTYTTPLTHTFTEGIISFRAWTNDSVNNINTTNVTFVVDVTNPVIVLNAINNQVTPIIPYNITFDYGVSDTNINSCWWSFGGSSYFASNTFNNSLSIESLSFPNNNYCYQEFANTTSCGNPTAGNYSFSNKFNDGDWEDYGVGGGFYYINYTKPYGVIANGSQWITRMITNNCIFGEILFDNNLSLPTDCWNYDTNKLLFAGWTNGTKPQSGHLYCYNGTWKEIASGGMGCGFGGGTSVDLKEEAMLWNLGTNRYLAIPENISITSATMNVTGSISGYLENLTNWNYGQNLGTWTDLSLTYDGNWNSYGYYSSSSGTSAYGYFDEQFTIPNYTSSTKLIQNLTYHLKDHTHYSGTDSANIEIYVWNYTKSGFDTIASYTDNLHFDPPSDKYYTFSPENRVDSNGIVRMYFVVRKAGASGTLIYRFFEDSLTYSGTPSNVSISIGSNKIFEKSGNFTSSNITSNFASYINSYLNNCTYQSGYCYVPVTFGSETSGLLRYSNMLITTGGNLNCSASSQTISVPVEGWSNLTIYANDLAGNINNASRNFYTQYHHYEQATDQTTTIEGDIVEYNLTVYMTNISTTTAKLIFNNALEVEPDSFDVGPNYYIFRKSLAIPAGSGSITGNNVNWSWKYTIENYITNYTTTPSQQTIYSVNIGDCGGNYTDVILNFTMIDEASGVIIPINATPQIQVDARIVSIGDPNIYFQYNRTFNSNNGAICIPNITLLQSSFYLYVTGSYIADGYAEEFFYLDKGNLSYNKSYYDNYQWTPRNIYLRDLLLADSKTFLFTYSDENQVKQPNAIVTVLRYYVGEGVFKEVERGKQDNNGETHLHLVEEDVIYKFRVTLDNELLYESDEYNAKCLASPCSITLDKPTAGGEFETDFTNLEEGTYHLSSNKNTRIVSLEFNLNDTGNMNLSVYKYSNVVNSPDVLVGSSSVTAKSGTVTVPIPLSYGNATYYAVVEHNNDYVTQKFVDMSESGFTYFGPLGIFLAAILVLTLGLIAISSGPWTIVFLIVGLIIASITKLLAMDFYLIVWITCAGLIVVWKLVTRRQY